MNRHVKPFLQGIRQNKGSRPTAPFMRRGKGRGWFRDDDYRPSGVDRLVKEFPADLLDMEGDK